MSNLFKIITLSILSILILSSKSFALNASSMTECSSTGNVIAAASGGDLGYCRFTPLKYQVSIFEMGVCTANPLSGNNFDRTICSTTFSASDTTNGFSYDMVNALDGTVELTGTSTKPDVGTYSFPYVIISNTVTVRGEFTNGGTTHYGLANGTVDQSGPSADNDSALITFGPNTACDGEYIGATATNGTINAYLTNTTLTKRLSSDYVGSGNDGCGSSATKRLVGVMNLDTPISITNNTINFKFTFNIRNYGTQFIETGGNNIPDLISQGPFGGFFETVEGAPQ
jgi:hypothetical protein